MPISRYPQWRQRGSQLLTAHCLPDETACITADGRTVTRSEVVDLILAGRDSWNEFRASLPHIQWYRGQVLLPGFILQLNDTDFRRRDLSEYDFTGCDFLSCNFVRAKFNRANLAGAGPHGTFEWSTKFVDCNLRSTIFQGSDLGHCSFEGSDLSHAELNGVTLHGTDLSKTKLFKTLIAADFNDTKLFETNFQDSYLLGSQFVDTDLSKAKNLSKAKIFTHITLDHRTLFKSGSLPKSFYRSCGLPEQLIDYLPSLVEDAINIQSCFISYSSKDELFAERLYEDLQNSRVPCFYAPKDLKIGSVIRDAIEQALHIHDRVLIVLSTNSILSTWVEHEVEAAFERERAENRTVLFPIRLDDAVMSSKKGWAANLRRQRHIGDFVIGKTNGSTLRHFKGFCQISTSNQIEHSADRSYSSCDR
jgi:uncharacterized protein YjbI with pentapeptide repeats